MRILAVDDDDILLELLTECLKVSGYTDVYTVNSAKAALDLLGSLDPDADEDEPGGAFDCFLLDIQMPGMDGITLCKQIRKMPQYAKTPILMLTAMTDRSFVERAFARGATDYITKPFDTFELGARIRMASILMVEQRRALDMYFAASKLSEDGGRTERKGFENPTVLKTDLDIVEYSVLETCLLRLTRAQRQRAAAVAFRITNANELFDALPEAEYEAMLNNVAEVINANLGTESHLLSHFGSGYFVCISDRSNKAFSKLAIHGVDEASVALKATSCGLTPKVVVGKPATNPPAVFKDDYLVLVDAIGNVPGNTESPDEVNLTSAPKRPPSAANFKIA